MTLTAIGDEQQARLCGRARAKEVFQPKRWKRIGSLPDEAAKLYESARRSSINSYSLRAVKPLKASLDEVEAVLTGQTALLGRDDTPSLLARLLPATYVSGGQIARYSTLEHSTSERENVALQYARLKPYTANKQQQESSNTTLLEAVDNFVLLGYTLSTKLQRSDTSKSNETSKVSVSVPSLLHLYRPVSAPSFAERRHDFQDERLAQNDFSITYIIQESSAEEEESKESSVTLEVVLTCSLDPVREQEEKEVLLQQKQRLRHDALCLTRLQPFIDAYREEKQRASVALSQTREPQHDPKDCDPNMLRGSMFAGGRTCGVCHRKFGPFRWKRHCESCEKTVCNQCLSVLAAAPSLSRRKKRVCSQCLYGETANVAAMHKAAAEAAHDDGKASIGTAKALALPDNRTINVFQFPNLETLVSKRKLSNASSTAATPRASGRVQIDFGLDPSLASSVSRTPDRRRARSRQSQLSQGSVASSTSNGCTASSFVTATPDIRRSTLSGRADLDEGESAVAKSIRTRRAKTVLLDDPNTKPVAHSHRSLNFITPLSSTAPTHSLYLTEEKRNEVQEPQQEVANHRTSSYRSSKIQFVQLKTPEPDYELDYNWYNIFPKAPIHRSASEKARARYVEVSGLRVDAHSLVFLRHDSELESLARSVLKVASQWHGCSINIVGSFEVYCLVTASNKPEIDLDDELLELEASPVIIDDVIPREESVSSYAVHHCSPFFVADMEHDQRFRAHPLHIDQGAVSLFSLPIYSSGADTSGSLSNQAEAYCVATLDLWKRDNVPASSHVSKEWMSSVGDLLRKISARLEALALESHAFLKPRSRANHSLGSSCDSRGSTRRADSIIDLYDIDSESVVDSPPLSQAETMDRLTNLSYAKVRGLGFTGMGGPGSSTWKYDSDNESTTSSQSASSQSSRFSSHMYSASDIHSTIESLLHQASQTSKFISETGVSI